VAGQDCKLRVVDKRNEKKREGRVSRGEAMCARIRQTRESTPGGGDGGELPMSSAGADEANLVGPHGRKSVGQALAQGCRSYGEKLADGDLVH